MLNIKIIKSIKKYIILFIIFISIGVYTGYKLNNRSFTSTTNDIKVKKEDTILQKIRTVSKLVPLEVDLSETIVIDDSIGNLSFLQKYKRVKFYANCSYSVDLSNLSIKDISYSQESSTLQITLPEPTVLSIDIDENKTVLEETTNGLLRFGDVKLTTDEYNSIQKELTKTFEAKLKTDDLIQKARDNSIQSIKNLLSTILNEDLKIEIIFKTK